MLFRFFKKLIKYYIDKLVHWLRMQKLQFELNNEIKKYHDSFEKKEEPKIREVESLEKMAGVFLLEI